MSRLTRKRLTGNGLTGTRLARTRLARTRLAGTRLAGLALAALVLPLGLVACGDGERARFLDPDDPAASPDPPPDAPPLTLEITPDPGATDLPISTEIGTDTTGEITDVTLTSAGGDTVGGELRDDGSAWVPERPLAASTTYTASVTATGAGGETTTAETEFTTMAAPGSRTGTGLYLFDDHEYGVAMPVVVEFVQPVPEEARAEVQHRMFVTTDPPQPGVWHWVPNGGQAFYRAKEYWQPGTTIRVRIALDGHPTGEGRYGDTDRSATATIGRKLEMKVDNDTKQMSVYEDGKLIKEMPVSLGKETTPSSYGHMVVMSKEENTIFDTFDELGPEDGYRLPISYAMRLTWGGEYIHAAPWSVADQGVRNVSHGCVNLSWDNAEWLFNKALIGDPVTVAGTERELAHGNGWTAWDVSWEEFVEGSALPVPDELLTG